jgi:hypothetical protein
VKIAARTTAPGRQRRREECRHIPVSPNNLSVPVWILTTWQLPRTRRATGEMKDSGRAGIKDLGRLLDTWSIV